MYKDVLALIEAYDTIIIHRHSRPDGDAMGSQIGLKHLITANYPHKTVFMVGDEARHFGFLPDSVMDDITDDTYTGALAILLDSAAPHLISDHRYTLAAKTARIDHHIYCETFTDVEVVDTSYESCCGMVADMAVQSGWRINATAALALYTGMVTDSGRFRYDATSARTFRLASVLMETGFDTADLFRNLYADNLEGKQLKARFTLKIQRAADGVAYIYTPREEFDALGLDTFTVSRGMVNTMADLKGVDIWVNFTETAEGVLCELRSNRYNINPVAVKYGGGGHQKASGATVPDRATAMAMLVDLETIAQGGQV